MQLESSRRDRTPKAKMFFVIFLRNSITSMHFIEAFSMPQAFDSVNLGVDFGFSSTKKKFFLLSIQNFSLDIFRAGEPTCAPHNFFSSHFHFELRANCNLAFSSTLR